MYENNLTSLVFFLAELYDDKTLMWLNGLCVDYPQDVRRAVLQYWHKQDDKNIPSLAQIYKIVKEFRDKKDAESLF